MQPNEVRDGEVEGKTVQEEETAWDTSDNSSKHRDTQRRNTDPSRSTNRENSAGPVLTNANAIGNIDCETEH